MNKQIQTLIDQSTTVDPDGFRYFDKQKFAELIVRECAEVAVTTSSGMIFPADVSSYVTAGKVNSAKMIKQHFGVE